MRKFNFRLLQLTVFVRYIIYKIISVFYRNRYNNVWLLSERGDEARDNAYAFYKYLKINHPEVCVKYVISKKSPDINKINSDDIVYLRSREHFIYYITAKYLISTHLYGYAPEFRLFNRLCKLFGFFLPSGKKIFLQHGITMSDIPELYYSNTKLDLFICASPMEYRYVKENFGYPDSVVKLTGFARYDDLIDTSSKYILLMPTWRKKLFYINNSDDFKKTEYYSEYNKLINDERLLII